MGTVSSVQDSTRPHPPTPRLDEEAGEARLPDVAAWSPPEPEAGVERLPEPELQHRSEPGAERLSGLETRAAREPEVQGGPAQPSGRASRRPRHLEGEAGEPRLPEAAVRAPSEPPLTGKPTPPLDLPLPVLVLTEQVRRAPEDERPELAWRLNDLLLQMAAGGGDRQVADTFHRLLETGKLEGLVDVRGRSCRAVAVEALLSLGYPYALEVRPEDLEHLRSTGRGLAPTRLAVRGPLVPAGVLLAGLGAQIVQELTRPGGPDSLVTTQVGLAGLALMALWLAPPRSPVYRLGLGLLALVSVLLLAVPLVADASVGPWAGLAGLVAVLLAALRES